MKPIHLLDHGYIRLLDSMGNDLSVVRAARCSYDAEWRTGEDEGKDEGLLRYLTKNRHSTPFEAVTLQFEVQAPIFVFRQWHRHRTQSYNEMSARYVELPEVFYVPDVEQITQQTKSNKQQRGGVVNPNSAAYNWAIRDACENAFVRYRELLNDDDPCPRELARGVLPFNTYSRMFVTMNLHNAFHFIGLRDHSHAQYEIRVYAAAMREMIRTVAPVSMKVWEENQLREEQKEKLMTLVESGNLALEEILAQ